MALTASAAGASHRSDGLRSEKRPALHAQRMEQPQQLGAVFVRHRLHQRTPEQLVGALVEFGDRVHRLERALVLALEAVQARGHVFQPQLDELDVVCCFTVSARLLGDVHSVEPRRQRLYRLQHGHDLRVLLLRDLAGHEDAEVTDILVHQPDDHLPPCLDLLGAAVHVGDPVERLLRGRDVVAHRGEQHDRHLDLAQVEDAAFTGLDRSRAELVADEEVLRDPLDLLGVHQEVAAPPALELEEARRLGVHVREDVDVLVPEGVGRVQVLEVLDQPGAVELARAEVRHERRQPGAAEQAARIAHRVVALALAPGTAPVRHRRADDHERAGVVGMGRCQHHGCPAGLAVADDGGLG